MARHLPNTARKGTRQIFLGDTLHTENMRASCEHGVLTLTIPVAGAAKPRRVQVGEGSDAQKIEPQAAGGASAHPRAAAGRRGGAEGTS